MHDGDDDRRYLSSDAFRHALTGLEEEDRLRLKRKADSFAYIVGMEPDDILHEAITRTLEGSRRCPADVEIVVYLGNAMRSIASEQSRKAVSEVHAEATDDPRGGVSSYDHSGPADAPASHTELYAVLARLESHFENDQEAYSVVWGLLDGSDPEEIRQRVGMSDTEYQTARRRVRRAIERLLR